ncbi:MAG: hypothetical protein HUU60_12450 [Armatimonadetes bacterium]|nr:hypothetical protein [Armatimonadota bacterium]
MGNGFAEVLRRFSEAQVDFVVIGGVAAVAHGAATVTYDLDIVYERSPENLGRMVEAMRPLKPYLRDAPEGLPFIWDEKTLQRGLNFTLMTTAGAVDLLGEVAGGSTYGELKDSTITLRIFGIDCPCVSLEKLIQLKRAAGRPKDLAALAEIEALRDARSDG